MHAADRSCKYQNLDEVYGLHCSVVRLVVIFSHSMNEIGIYDSRSTGGVQWIESMNGTVSTSTSN
jgi:hypothetical protein